MNEFISDEIKNRISKCYIEKKTDLDLSNLELESIPNLEDLLHLKSIDLSYNNINKIEELNHLTQLNELDLSSNRISKIEGLDQLLQLSSLDLSNNNISRIEGLDQLLQLSNLDLSSNNISKIEGLDQLFQLSELELSSNNISKIEGLDQLFQLSSLDLSNNNISRIEGLDQLLQLSNLDLSSNNISKIDALERHSQIFKLELGDNNISKIEGLDQLLQLTELNLSHNNISKIEGLDQLLQLTELNLSRNNISKIEGLDQLLQLSYLKINDNQISRIEALENITQLLSLDIGKNKISKIENLKTLEKLKRLSLINNKIKKIENLDKLINLEKLVLTKNSINEIENLESLKNLKELFLSYNNLNNLNNIKHLTNIVILGLNNNNLEALDELDSLKNITVLNLRKNKINNLDQLEIVLKLKKLKRLHIGENPLWLEYGIIFENIPFINNLDSVKLFWDQKDSYIEEELPCNIVLLGNHAVGKSSFVANMLKKRINQKSTHGLMIELYHQKNKKFPTAVYYDFGGQDFYHGIYQLFLKQQAIKIIIVNPETNINQLRKESEITVTEDNQYTQDFNINYWSRQIDFMQVDQKNNKTNEKKNLLLIQSHFKEGEQKKWDYINYINHDKLYDFIALDLNQTNNHNFNEFKKKFNRYLLKNLMRVKLSPERIRLTNEVLKIIKNNNTHKEPQSIIELKDKYFDKNYSLDSFKFHLEQLNASGLIFYDKNIVNGDYVWLNPKALVKDLYDKILSKNHFRNSNKQGVISISEIKKIGINKYTLELLEFYNIIFKHNPNKSNLNDVEYIIPNYLPLVDKKDPFYILSTFGLKNPSFTMRFLEFIPTGMINHLVCFFGRQPDYKIFWRDMVLFTLSEGTKLPYRVLIHLDLSSLTIKTYIEGCKNEYFKVCKYIFYCLMRFYWDLHATDKNAATFEDFFNKKGDVLDQDINYIDLSDDNSLLSRNYIWKEFYKSQKDIFDDKNIFVPNDLYISFDEKCYVHYPQLIEHKTNNPTIKAYNLSENNKPIALEIGIPVSPFSIFTEKDFISVKKIFISYSRQDVEYKNILSLFLKTSFESSGHEIWDCGELEVGKWDDQIQSKLEQADLVICMLSINFFASNYILEKELIPILKAAEEGKKQIMCIIVKNFPWDKFAQLGQKAELNNLSLTNKDTIEHEITRAKAEITNYQFLPYSTRQRSSINSEFTERLIPLNQLSEAERDDVYVDIVNRVAKTLGI